MDGAVPGDYKAHYERSGKRVIVAQGNYSQDKAIGKFTYRWPDGKHKETNYANRKLKNKKEAKVKKERRQIIQPPDGFMGQNLIFDPYLGAHVFKEVYVKKQAGKKKVVNSKPVVQQDSLYDEEEYIEYGDYGDYGYEEYGQQDYGEE